MVDEGYVFTRPAVCEYDVSKVVHAFGRDLVDRLGVRRGQIDSIFGEDPDPDRAHLPDTKRELFSMAEVRCPLSAIVVAVRFLREGFLCDRQPPFHNVPCTKMKTWSSRWNEGNHSESLQ